jgi:hypothetical protein
VRVSDTIGIVPPKNFSTNMLAFACAVNLNDRMKTVPLEPVAGRSAILSYPFVARPRRLRANRILAMLAGLAALLASPISSAAPGDLYVPQTEAGLILKFSSDGTKSTFASGLDHPGGLAFDRTGNLFVSVGPGLRDITKITPSGEMTVFATGLSLPGGLAFDGADNLYVTYSTGDTGGIWTRLSLVLSGLRWRRRE